MACKCLEEIPNAVKEVCNKNKDYLTPVARIEIEGVIKSSVDASDIRLAATMKIHTVGSNFPKIEPNIFTYCPFCGVKYQEEV